MTTITANSIDSVSKFVLTYCDRKFGQDGLDIGQDVLEIIVRRRMADMADQADLKRWLKKLCHQQRADHIRKIQSEKRAAHATVSISGDDSDNSKNVEPGHDDGMLLAEDVNAERMQRIKLRIAIGKLPQHLRDVIECDLRGNGRKAYADRYGISEPAACKRAKKAHATLRRMLEE